MKLDFYLLDVRYKIINNKTIIELFGKTKKEHICIIDEYLPYFYIEVDNEKIIDKIKNLEIKEKRIIKIKDIKKVKKKVLGEEKTLFQVFCEQPADIQKVRHEIKDAVVNTYEFDISFSRRYMVDKEIYPFTKLEVEVEEIKTDFRIKKYQLKKLKSTKEHLNEYDVLALDIETYFSKEHPFDSEKNPILMISFYSNKIKKVITWKNMPPSTHLEIVKDEKELIKRTIEIIKESDPDFVTGYYSDGFDFPYLQSRAKKLKIKFDVGYDNSELYITEDKALIYGFPHIDLLKFIRRTMSQTLETSSYKLDEVASEVLGEKKHNVDITQLPIAWDDNDLTVLRKFVDYNLQDSKLTFRLFEKLFPNIQEMMTIIGLPPIDINRMGFSQFVEWHMIRKAKDMNEIILSKPKYDQITQRRSVRMQGAFVYEPKAGLYEDIVVFDFRSLYPSIITSHNLSLSSFKKGKKTHVNPDDKGIWFGEKQGFMAKVLEDIIKFRTTFKNKLKKDKDNVLLKAKVGTLKILANSFYGYLAFYGSRWYCIECGQTTTAFGRFYIKQVIAEAEKTGFKVIYSDTDSIFLTIEGKTQKDAHNFVDKINSKLPEMMELEFEDFYKRGLFVSAKGSDAGAKKRYALSKEDGKLKIIGFESVRRNTSLIAKEVQEKVLNLILIDNNIDKAVKYVKGIVKDLQNKKIKNEKLKISTKISKPLDQYDSIGPHVAVGLKMQEAGNIVTTGTVVEYIMKDVEGLIRDKADLLENVPEGKYDAEYYINNQVLPSVVQILEVFGYDKDELQGKGSQTGLNKFFG